jgi:AcrR family transcriptional regulator
MAVDRRVARTRTALYDALVALIRRKDYDLITVQDILEEANVGRATFYAHFTSKDDLLKRSLERLRDLLTAVQGRRPDAPFHWNSEWSPSRALFEHVADFADVQSALAGGRGGALLRDAIDEVLASVLRASMPPEGDSRLPRDLAILHIVSTVNTTLRWWLERRKGMSAAEADALFKELVLGGLSEQACASFITAGAANPLPPRGKIGDDAQR